MELTAFAELSGHEVAGVFEETASGASASRAARSRLIDLAQTRQIAAILVRELARWGRSTQDLPGSLQRLAGRNVPINAVSGMTFKLNAPCERMMANMLAGIAQFGRDLISERVKAGLVAARARGKELGRLPGKRPKLDRSTPRVLTPVGEGCSYRWIARDLGISNNTVSDFLERNRLATALAQ